MNDFAVDVKSLVKEFGKTRVVDDVALQIPKGQVWGFLGPNGSGKTTTIRMLCGLLTPTQGSGTCLGLDIITEAEKIKLQTGYMTQKFSFWEDLSIRENLDFVSRMYNLPNRKAKVDDVIARLDLTQRQHQLAGDLSGGWKQRLALAAVTMHNPKLLLLDEPTAGVDPKARREFWDQIHELTNQGITILVSTHYMDEAERCDQIAYLAHGKLITQGTVRDVIAASNLTTYVSINKGVRQFASALKAEDDIENVSYFGAALHISSTNTVAIENVIKRAPFDSLDWQKITPSLEDVFISLMTSVGNDKRDYQ
ncbi:ABC transporter ATP-binding protein [Psychrosphaera sp. B3R10]|uniref:ABC transporter ATP-binding protein n=1 Tax=Psychrosphaera algicola TaxID=3023714 RepID=A0ABT5FFL8_9GAMM|nr:MULTISPECIES: ABC transporter ATP-binding protein [unclassified Psychrosphaera]MBU2882535.1 ABC transporter ATP-binding protein [Psychrosphaera sp. I2R16]MBU2989447.1 ABC transporter ATP-binding protein [Psychrosphaera sp. B3R10]MDC2889402.1 ABC transporter ATP-binding protein [Psychrosphaera sp. G1-22]MDO6718281.1 ABC transporter ATP-binding protein [Psychrosphaera sp. 1_MG-2023]